MVTVNQTEIKKKQIFKKAVKLIFLEWNKYNMANIYDQFDFITIIEMSYEIYLSVCEKKL